MTALREASMLSSSEIADRVGPHTVDVGDRMSRCIGCPGGCSRRHTGIVFRRTYSNDIAAALASLHRAKVVDKYAMPDRRVAWSLSEVGRRLVDAIDPDDVLASLDFPTVEHPSIGGGTDG